MGMTTEQEQSDIKRKIAASERAGGGYRARLEALRKRLDELNMKAKPE